jgi:5-methylcytosine-specific restriction endonuclease McrA
MVKSTVRYRVCVYDLWRHQRGKCFYCDCPITHPSQLTIDHVVPKSHGGTDHSGNLVACCLSCNELFGGVSAKMKIAWMKLHILEK